MEPVDLTLMIYMGAVWNLNATHIYASEVHIVRGQLVPNSYHACFSQSLNTGCHWIQRFLQLQLDMYSTILSRTHSLVAVS